MTIPLVTQFPAAVGADWLVVPIWEQGALDASAEGIDSALGGVLSRLRESGDVSGKLSELTRVLDVPSLAADRLLLVGLGQPEQVTPARLYRAWMTAVRDICTRRDRSVAVTLPVDLPEALSPETVAETAALALEVGNRSQQLYRGEPERHPLKSAVVVASPSADIDSLTGAVERGKILGEAVNLTRELVNRHPGEVYPESFADRAAQVATQYGLGCDILDEHRLRAERMNSLLGVAQGSVRPPRMVVLEHRGAGPDQPWLALVGKGVTFDSGGLSLKPSDSMKTMKGDMAGAATVLGAMTALARLKAPVNVVGLLGLVENMLSGSSYKLGEVLTARNGVTIEVMNTDAEGRLVLADVLSYAVDRGVTQIVDLATLTGSCVVALGEEIAGAFTNCQPWCDTVLQAARTAGEEVWQLPMSDSFNEQLKSEVADCKNVGTRWGGAITAAKFLEKFVSSVPWVHLDIAGPAFAESSKPHLDGGGTGAFVRTLVTLASQGAR